jgi:1,4-alpha-glucan branching enzyme
MRRTKAHLEKQPNGENIKTANVTDVVITLDRPEAQAVYLCGDFNEWSPRSLRMFQRGASGEWERRVQLRPGRYEYKFIVDGEWTHDPAARENTSNAHGTLNSIIEVHECASGIGYDHAPRQIQPHRRNDLLSLRGRPREISLPRG